MVLLGIYMARLRTYMALLRGLTGEASRCAGAGAHFSEKSAASRPVAEPRKYTACVCICVCVRESMCVRIFLDRKSVV